MKRLPRVFIFFFVIALSVMPLAACQSGHSGSYRQISAQDAIGVMDSEKDCIILDVRTADEYSAGHIPGAVCVPNESITDAPPAELPDHDQLILVYCRSGRRSKEAAQKLADMGYTNIVEFGGIIDWPGPTEIDSH